jgi:hypothetical protein
MISDLYDVTMLDKLEHQHVSGGDFVCSLDLLRMAGGNIESIR